MKIVVNKCYGGFSLSKTGIKLLDLEDDFGVDRTNERLIELVEANAPVSGRYANLAVVKIPDEATDWEINEYDGFESITYVLNGKLHHA